MACSKCGRSKTANINQNSLRIQSNEQLSGGSFLQLRYVGETGATLPTLLSHVSYGSRAYGDLMYVAQIDFETYPGIWMTQDDFSSISA